MLVLSRFPGQSVVVGDDVVISVERVRGDRVWLGVTAPREISVHRQEVYEEIQKEKGNRNDDRN